MAIFTNTSLVHWNYFLSMEKDLENLSRYVEFSSDNFGCYSLEISRILFSAASEIDVIASQICRKISPVSNASSINSYRDEITSAYPTFPAFKVLVPRFGLEELTPWSKWGNQNGVPDWWTAYNKVKHHRNTEFHKANFKNAINAVAGLFVIVLYFYKEKAESGELIPIPSLFRVTDEHFDGTTFNDIEFGINYTL